MALARVSVRITHPNLGGDGANVWHLRTTGADLPTSSEVEGLLGIVEDFYTAVAAIFPDTAAFIWDGTAAGVGPDEGDSFAGTGWTVVGATAGQILPPANAIVVGWRTSTGGRMGRGRTFLGPIVPAAAQTDGTIDTAELATVRAAAAALVAASEGFANGALGVWSEGRSGHPSLPDADAAFRDFVGTVTRDLFAVLRSRRD